MPAITPGGSRRDWRRVSGPTSILSLIKVPTNGTSTMKPNVSASTTSAEVILANAELAASAGHKVQYRKTKVCPWNGSGRCVLGDRCNYAHSPEELRTRPDLSRTKLCPKGTECPNKTICSFAHDVSELRATGVFYRTKICKFWKEGRCPAGEFCRHAHGEDQIRDPLVLPSVQENNHQQNHQTSFQKPTLIPKDCGKPENHDANRQRAHPFLLRALSTPLYYPFEYNQCASNLEHFTRIDSDLCHPVESPNPDSQRFNSQSGVDFLRRCDSLQIDTSFLCSMPIGKTDAALETEAVQELPTLSEKEELDAKTVISRTHTKLLSHSSTTTSTTTDCCFTEKLLRDDEDTSSQETGVRYSEKFPMRKANTSQGTADVLQETSMREFTAVKDALENLFFTVNQSEKATIDQGMPVPGTTAVLGCHPLLTKRPDNKLARQSSNTGTLSLDYGLQSHSTSPRNLQKDFFLPLETAPSRGGQCLLSRTSSLSTEDPGAHPELMTPTFSGFTSEEPTPRGLSGMHHPSLPTGTVCWPSPFSSAVMTTNCTAQPRTDALGNRGSVFDRFPWQAHFSLGERDCTSLNSIGSDIADGQQQKPQAQLSFQSASDPPAALLNNDPTFQNQRRLLSDERPASAIAWATNRSLSAHIPYTLTPASYGGNSSRLPSDFELEGELKLNDILNIAVASRDPELLECSAKILRASLKYKDHQPHLRPGQALTDSFMW